MEDLAVVKVVPTEPEAEIVCSAPSVFAVVGAVSEIAARVSPTCGEHRS